MKHLLLALPVILLLFAPADVKTQIISNAADKTYGFDPLLYNGKFYTYFFPSDTKGSPFFNGPEFVNGSVSLRGVDYDSLLLKYDVFNRQLILQYTVSTGGVKHIVLSDAWMESFNLGEAHFKLLTFTDTTKNIYQVIGIGPTQVLYSWYKLKSLDTHTGANSFLFTEPRKITYLLTGNTLRRYKKNKSFVTQFDPGKQAGIRKYLLRQKINVAKASDHTMMELVSFCNSPTPL